MNRMMPMTMSVPVSVLLLAACGGGASPQAQSAARAPAAAAIVDPAALYCAGTGGAVIAGTAGGRRADLCRLPDGRTVRAADLLNSHNDL
ncbi:DUF333 domain-containing protein [Paracoccus luteus]|uniref:DUF333 domain-containing protein n=1 Tax=Paracoccus luteus TaxID=2508543 RepID=UPI00106FD77B|nr:DUF333 domain-containing protein [Paracoccus luteus]